MNLGIWRAMKFDRDSPNSSLDNCSPEKNMADGSPEKNMADEEKR